LNCVIRPLASAETTALIATFSMPPPILRDYPR
jgi:hypothetical protein